MGCSTCRTVAGYLDTHSLSYGIDRLIAQCEESCMSMLLFAKMAPVNFSTESFFLCNSKLLAIGTTWREVIRRHECNPAYLGEIVSLPTTRVRIMYAVLLHVLMRSYHRFYCWSKLERFLRHTLFTNLCYCEDFEMIIGLSSEQNRHIYD
jgi:hypothetical protein